MFMKIRRCASCQLAVEKVRSWQVDISAKINSPDPNVSRRIRIEEEGKARDIASWLGSIARSLQLPEVPVNTQRALQLLVPVRRDGGLLFAPQSPNVSQNRVRSPSNPPLPASPRLSHVSPLSIPREGLYQRTRSSPSPLPFALLTQGDDASLSTITEIEAAKTTKPPRPTHGAARSELSLPPI